MRSQIALYTEYATRRVNIAKRSLFGYEKYFE